MRALGDLELFINGDEYNAYPLIKTALIHSQFETIHPFNDGNGRADGMLIMLYLLRTKQVTVPVLYLSSYFRKFQDVYYSKISDCHDGKVYSWIEFLLETVIEVANSAISVCEDISKLHDRDYEKFLNLPKRHHKRLLRF